MIRTGKAFRLARVPVAKRHIDMRYSADDGIWYPSQPTPMPSGMDNSFGTEDAEISREFHPNVKEKNILIIICDNDENTTSNQDEGSVGYRRNSEAQRPMILIVDVDSVQDPSGDQAELVSTPYPPADINGPLTAERSLPMA